MGGLGKWGLRGGTLEARVGGRGTRGADGWRPCWKRLTGDEARLVLVTGRWQ